MSPRDTGHAKPELLRRAVGFAIHQAGTELVIDSPGRLESVTTVRR